MATSGVSSYEWVSLRAALTGCSTGSGFDNLARWIVLAFVTDLNTAVQHE